MTTERIGAIIEQDAPLASADASRQFGEIIMARPVYRLYPTNKPLVIVLDGLDEGYKKTNLLEGKFLEILSHDVCKLPSNFRFIVTCRQDHRITPMLESKDHIYKYSSPLSGNLAYNDIQLYVDIHLSGVKNLPKNAPEVLIKKAEGLFIWVATVVNFLKDSTSPKKQFLRLIKQSSGDLPQLEKMEYLYKSILDECNWKDVDFKKGYSIFMGTILTLRTPLSASIIDALHHPDDIGSVYEVLSPLRSLCHGLDLTKMNELVYPLHLSLQEFLTDQKQASEPYFIDEEQSHQQLAICCVRILKAELNNVSGLGFSREYREEYKNAIIHLPALDNVTQQLEYSCKFCISHIDHATIQTGSNSVAEISSCLTTEELVAWLELVTIKDRFLPIYNWIQIHDNFSDLAQKFQNNDVAHSIEKLSSILYRLGRFEEALRACQEAVNLQQQLAKDRPEVFTADLAWSLNNFSVHLAKFGHHEEALEASQEAVNLQRQLAKDRPDVFTADLASSLRNFSSDLASFGRHEEALKACQEAVNLHHQLAKDRPDMFTAQDFALSLSNFSVHLANFEHHEEALEACQAAVNVRRKLAKDRPDMFTADLALSLNNLSVRLAKFGCYKEALEASQEAVNLQRQLAKDRPEVFTADLALLLSNFSADLASFGHWEEALEASQEAINLQRQLAKDRPEVFTEDLARSLLGLSLNLSKCGSQEEALKASQESVDLLQLDIVNPDLSSHKKLLKAAREQLDACKQALLL
ncbi:TPR-like protein [Artomyces pyxidatus]|uniref:TPR-like protein n=1 Tax=Artomyces pyxidatus TaxID=48021 RepID=A0ACB8T8R6_9AGAM|nr:TPR-like protein [Artomyces pyxidatus]